jgi:asparagine synthase (glutamine-hydrolysing)
MCSWLLTNVADVDINQANFFQRLRGPDLTNVVKVQGITFVHNLLSITGAFTPEPFTEDGLACVYNGEIYNCDRFGTFDSDGKCLLPAYMALGYSFIRELDGEFAIAIVDWRSGSLLIGSDVFGTKPIHYSIEGSQFGVASYASALKGIGFTSITRLPPNQLLVIDLDTNRIQMRSSIYDFSTAQYKRDFDDWIIAFQNAISKRTYNCREGIFIGLSSGYDSGAISAELNKQCIDYKSYSVMRNEKVGIIESRIAQRPQGSQFEYIYPTETLKADAHHYLEINVEPIFYNIFSTRIGHVESTRLHDDYGANGLSIVCARAKRDGRRVYLSGQGADEIFADYGFAGKPFYPHSNFGGKFPEDLNEIFPWASFFGSSQASYLMKEEYVAGSYGIEARYPFLDREVVQEFLSLSHSLKNSCYKSVLRHYLDQIGYPCAFDEKYGFEP